MISGPELLEPLSEHSMVPLGLGQAIIGGFGLGQAISGGKTIKGYTKKIYLLECSQKDCSISKIVPELSIPLGSFVAIPIPDFFSGCISEGKT